MAKWQNLELAFFDSDEIEGIYDFPKIEPVYELPKVNRYIEFDYCKRVREDRNNIAVHFFEDDYKFERVWTGPDRYGEMLCNFSYVIGPDFSTYIDFPKAMQIYNHYRNNWLCRYWQICYNMTVVPTVLYGDESTWDWCFDGLPKHSILAISNVGDCRSRKNKKAFLDGYNEMLRRLEPTEVLFYTRNFMEIPGNVHYIRWEIHKGDQLNAESELQQA